MKANVAKAHVVDKLPNMMIPAGKGRQSAGPFLSVMILKMTYPGEPEHRQSRN